MRILLTNNTLADRAGTELYVRDLAVALMKRGHYPVAYSTVLGDVAEELRQATIPVVDDLNKLGAPPDIIHGHHNLDTMTAVLHFPKTPAIFVCHGWLPWQESPPLFPSIRRYVAANALCRERLLTAGGISEENIEVVYNFVDLERFRLRGPLPPKPQSALIFGNYVGESSTVAAIRAGCARFGITRVDIIGSSSENAASNPEQIIGEYDVVFAAGRCALEAMASGCALIVSDFAGLGGLVTTENVAEMRRLNFGLRATKAGRPTTEDNVFYELQRYNPADARQVSRWIRGDADMSPAVTHWLEIYHRVIDDWQNFCATGTADLADKQLRAASDYLRSLAPILKAKQTVDKKSGYLKKLWYATGIAEPLKNLERSLRTKIKKAKT